MAAPADLAEHGAALWDSVVDRYTLDPEDTAVLHELCRCVDQLDALGAIVAAEGVREAGTSRAHPCLVEARHQRVVLAKLRQALALPDLDALAGRTPTRRRNR